MEKEMEGPLQKNQKAESSISSELHRMVLQVKDVLPDTPAALIECDLSESLSFKFEKEKKSIMLTICSI